MPYFWEIADARNDKTMSRFGITTLKLRMNRFFWPFFCLCSSLALAQQPTPAPTTRQLRRPTLTVATLTQLGDLLTVEEVVAQSVARNYQVQIAKAQEEISRNDRTLGNAGFLPSLTFNVQGNQQLQNLRQDYFGTAAPTRAYGAINRTSQSGLNLTTPIYAGGAARITLERLGEVVRLSEANTRANMEQTIADAMTAYYDVIRQLQRLVTFRQALDLSRDRLELARANYEVGTFSKVAFLTAQVDYNTDSAALVTQQQSLVGAKILLNSLLVRDPLTDFAIRDTILVRNDLSLHELQQAIQQNNPLLVQATLNRRVAALNTRLAQARQSPTVNFVAGYNFSTTDNAAGFGTQTARNDIVTTSVVVAVPIFNGYNLKRQIQDARVNERIAEYQQAEQKRQIDGILSQAFTQYRNALTLVGLQALNYQLAAQNVEIAYERYRVGNSTAIEFRDVQRSLVQAQTSLIDAEYTAKAAEIELLRLSSTIVNK